MASARGETTALAAKTAAAIVHIEVLRIAQTSSYDGPNSLLQRDVVEYSKVSRIVLPALTRIKADKSKRRKVTFRTEGRAIWQTYSEELSPLTGDLWIDNAHFHRAVYPTPYARLGVQIAQSSRRCLTQCPGRADFRAFVRAFRCQGRHHCGAKL